MDDTQDETRDGMRPDGTIDNLAADERRPADPANTQVDADPDLKPEDDR